MDLQDNDSNENLSKVELSEDKLTANKYTNKKVLLIAAVLLVGAPVLGTLFYKYSNISSIKQEETNENKKAENLYYDLTPIVVNLDTNNQESKFLKISITLMFDNNASLEAAKKLEPSLRDEYFVFLRQLRPSDVTGAVALYRLKDSLYIRTNKIIYPAEIKDVLIHDILIQ
jgi:flagellar basal body-associated protein FliL